jgi:two-component system chemotaxis response regulator CheB
MTADRVKVLIVDDSAVVRQVLTSVLAQDPQIDVLGAVPDPIFAMHRMNQLWPDVVLLDIEMPRMDGITFLKELMTVRPTPVVVCSTLTERGAQTTLQAMSAGAVAIITKPRDGLKAFLESDAADIARTVRGAAGGDMRQMKAVTSVLKSGTIPAQRQAAAGLATGSSAAAQAKLSVTTDRLIAIGTSTGGTQALEVVLTSLPRVSPGIVVVQHMPEKFTAAFAARLDGLCDVEVLEASDGDRVLPGRVLIAPGGQHMTAYRDGAQYRVRIADGPPVNRHKPSVDVLFRSVAECAGANAMGVIMTGMGDDGARGLRQMRDAGARTIGQDEATCVVYGMPGEAVKKGAVETEVGLQEIPGLIQRFASRS